MKKKKRLTKQHKDYMEMLESTPLRMVQYLLATKAMLNSIDMN